MEFGMSWIAPAVGGLMVGWLVEWVIDWVYWRRNGVSRAERDALLRQLRDQQSKLAAVTSQQNQRQADLNAARALIAHYEAELAALRAAGAQGQRDPLVDINGIGPAYQDRLYAAGITTFAQLADQSPLRLRQLVDAKSWQAIDPEAWIAEARAFAEQVRGGTYRKGRA